LRYRFLILFLLILISCNKEKEKKKEENIRIVSLAPSITKILFRLELQDKIVGVTDFCEYYGEIEKLVKLKKIRRVSGFYIINYENILSVNPDYILGTDSISYENKIQMEKIFSDKKIYWFVHPADFEGIKREIIEIGNIFNRKNKAKLLIKDIDNLLDEIQNKIKDKKEKPKILVEIFYPPFTTAGKNTFISDIIIKAGGRLSLSLNDNWPVVSLEDIIASDPDLVIKTHLANTSDELRLIRCYRENRIFIPKDIDIFLQPCYDSIFAVKELYEYLYEK